MTLSVAAAAGRARPGSTLAWRVSRLRFVVISRAPWMLFAALAGVPAGALAQDRCDCVVSECRAMEPAVVVLTGHVSAGVGSGASGRVEPFLAIELRRPVCVEVAHPDRPLVRVAMSSQRFELVGLDAVMGGRLRHMVGQGATLRGVLVQRRDAHTAVVFEVRAIERR
jgi:hypothetical protein